MRLTSWFTETELLIIEEKKKRTLPTITREQRPR
jgi:hypothetical protein